MTDKGKIDKISEREFSEFFIRNLDNPSNIWGHSFENQISKPSKYLLYTMLVSDDQIFEEDLEKSFWMFYRNESSKFNFEINQEDFINSVKELENTFIKISKVQRGRSYGLANRNKTTNLIFIIKVKTKMKQNFLKLLGNIKLYSSYYFAIASVLGVVWGAFAVYDN